MADADPESPDDTPQFEPDPKARLMQEVAAQMDAMEADLPDGFGIGRVITIVEVKHPNGDVGVRVRAGMYPWVALGLLEYAKKQFEQATSAPSED